MIRAAAKNCASVCCVVDPSDYEALVAEVGTDGTVSQRFRTQVALKAFQHTAQYDSMIATTLCAQANEAAAPSIHVDTSNPRVLRYGENPHQRAWVCASGTEGLAAVQPIQGKALSYNNMLDADAAYRSMMDLAAVDPSQNAVTVIKHLNPCGAALSGAHNERRWKRLGQGIQCLHLDRSSLSISQSRLTPLDSLKASLLRWSSPLTLRKKHCGSSPKRMYRVLKLPLRDLSAQPMVRGIDGGFLIQDEDTGADGTLECVHQRRRRTFTGTAALWNDGDQALEEQRDRVGV